MCRHGQSPSAGQREWFASKHNPRRGSANEGDRVSSLQHPREPFGRAACFLIYEQDYFASIAASSYILGIKSGSAAVVLHRVDYSARRVDAAHAWHFIQVELVWRRTNLFQVCPVRVKGRDRLIQSTRLSMSAI
jgi:hypothetical protein